jgi:hypothetical protein
LYTDAITGDPIKYINTIAGSYATTNTIYTVNIKDADVNPNQPIDSSEKKLLVEQGKQFQTVYVNALDTASISQEADYISWITSNIQSYISQHGKRYDDLIISSVNGGSPNHNFLIITIIRYY